MEIKVLMKPNPPMNPTLQYYDDHAPELMQRYSDVNLEHIHELIKKYFEPGGVVMELGAGSCREISWLLENGYDAYGLEGSEKLHAEALSKDPELRHIVFRADITRSWPAFAGAMTNILALALFMHFDEEAMGYVMQQLSRRTNPQARIIFSVPLDREKVVPADERYFNGWTEDQWLQLMELYQWQILEKQITPDAMNRGFSWLTICAERRRDV